MRAGFTYAWVMLLMHILSGCGRSYLFPVTQSGTFPEHLWGGTDPLKLFISPQSSSDNPYDSIVKKHNYRAIIKEVLKFNDQHVSDFQLVNANSVNAFANHGERFQYELNFYVIEIKRKCGPNSHFGLLTTAGSLEVLEKNKCGATVKTTRTYGLGPAYTGSLERSMDSKGKIDFRANKKYKINRNYTLKLAGADEVDIRFTIDEQLIRAGTNSAPPQQFRITKIVNHDINKISGKNKSLEFSIPEIFKDQDLLTFYFNYPP